MDALSTEEDALRRWPRLELIVAGRKSAVAKTKVEGDRGPSGNVRLTPQTHQELAARAALRKMSMGDYVEWLLSQVPIEDAELKKVLRRRER